MTGEAEGEVFLALVEQRLGRLGLHVKLDKGFEEGSYAVYVEFDDLASRVGFAAARRQAVEYCGLLKSELARCSGQSLGGIEDASRSGDPRRKRDLELTYLAFPVFAGDGRFHDDTVKEEFRLALLRAGQQWDQCQARADTRRHDSRRNAFRLRLGALLAGDAYAAVDSAIKERLLDEIPALAFPARGLGL